MNGSIDYFRSQMICVNPNAKMRLSQNYLKLLKCFDYSTKLQLLHVSYSYMKDVGEFLTETAINKNIFFSKIPIIVDFI